MQDLKKIIGSKFVIGFPGTEIDSTIVKLIEEYNISGFIFNQDNITSFDEFTALIKYIKKKSPHPLILAFDLSTLPYNKIIFDTIFEIPPPIAIAAINDIDYSRKYAEIVAANFAMLGLNTDTGISGNIINSSTIRAANSLGANKEKILNLLPAYLETLSELGLITSLAGFPGSGSSTQKSNTSPALNNLTLADLENDELQIFARANKCNVDIFFVSGDIFTAIDGSIPAFMSKTIVQYALSNLSGYSLVCANTTDSSVLNNYAPETVSISAVNAGIDMLFMERYYEKIPKIIDEIAALAAQNSELEKKLLLSSDKISFLRKKLSMFDNSELPPSEAQKIIYETFLDQIAQDSITVCSDPKKFIPIKASEFEIIGVVEPENITRDYLIQGANQDIFTFTQYCKDAHRSMYQIIPGDDSKWEEFSTIIYCLDTKSNAALGYLKAINSLNIKLILVFTDEVSVAQYYSEIRGARVYSYGFRDLQRQALASMLFGKTKQHGTDPFIK